MKMDSIVQGIRDNDLKDGEYEILAKDQVYTIELINYYDDVRYSLDAGQTQKIVSLGDNSKEYKMVVAKYHKNLTIDEGVTVTANTVDGLTYKKGMFICVLGDTYNNGEISMTARGTYNQEGENVYLWKNIDNSYEYVPAAGGEGAPSRGSGSYAAGVIQNGEKGKTGDKRSTGGGGSGGIATWRSLIYNASGGAAGTSYSGGAGGGGVYRWTNWNQAYDVNTYLASNAKPNGGAGGQGFAMQTDHTNAYSNGGGSGAGTTVFPNPVTGTRGRMYENILAEVGTGGLLVLYSDTLYNEGNITSNGSKGGTATGNGGCGVGGAGSGAGSINIFARVIKEEGNTQNKRRRKRKR